MWFLAKKGAILGDRSNVVKFKLMPKNTIRYEVEYRSVPITANIAEGLYPYLVAEAQRRKVSIDTLVSQIVNEDLGRKRIQSRKKNAGLPNGPAFAIAK